MERIFLLIDLMNGYINILKEKRSDYVIYDKEMNVINFEDSFVYSMCNNDRLLDNSNLLFEKTN